MKIYNIYTYSTYDKIMIRVYQHCSMYRLFIRWRHHAETNMSGKIKINHSAAAQLFHSHDALRTPWKLEWPEHKVCGHWGWMVMGGVKDLCSRSITCGNKKSASPAQGLRYKCGQFLTPKIEKWKLQCWSSETWLPKIQNSTILPNQDLGHQIL